MSKNDTLITAIYLSLHKSGYLSIGGSISSTTKKHFVLGDDFYLRTEVIRTKVIFGPHENVSDNFILTLVSNGVDEEAVNGSLAIPHRLQGGTSIAIAILDNLACTVPICFDESCKDKSITTINFSMTRDSNPVQATDWIASPVLNHGVIKEQII